MRENKKQLGVICCAMERPEEDEACEIGEKLLRFIEFCYSKGFLGLRCLRGRNYWASL